MRKVIRKVGLVILVTLGCSFPFVMHELIKSETKTTIVAQGVIDDKRSFQYRCGRKGNSACTEYIVTINNKEHTVTGDTFYNKPVGGNVTLSLSENVKITKLNEWQWFMFFVLSILPFGVLVVWVFAFLNLLFDWVFLDNAEISFKAYLKENGIYNCIQ